MTMDYELMENPEVKISEDKADRASQSNHAIAMNIPRTVVQLVAHTGGFLLYSMVIITINIWILPLLFISAAINWQALSRARKYNDQTREGRSKIERKLSALVDTMREPSGAKDMRLYGVFGWLQGLLNHVFTVYQYAEGR